MITSILSRCIILVFGTLYPAYASYKAVRNQDEQNYLKWIMYWIVFAFFTCFETFTDIFFSWLPFYYELKVIIVIWLLSPATEGSSVLYRNFVHPMLTKREKEIDEYINQAKEKGCSVVIQLGAKGVNYATSVIMQTALKNNALLRLTNGEGSGSQNRDEIDFSFQEHDELNANHVIYDESSETNSSRSSEGSSERSSDDYSYVGEAMEEIDDNDTFDVIVTRSRAASKTNATKKTVAALKSKNKKITQTARTTRAASVRF